ncbi:MAG: glycosyl transferase, partial [Sphingobacteriales bacterium]
MPEGQARIPKLIHYCWFGGRPLDELSLRCMDTWQEQLSGYVVRRWDEQTFDIDAAPAFVREAYAKKKFAFVSDYVRAWALYGEGGIYLDTDVSIRRSLDAFLVHEAFSGFERAGFPFTALWAAAQGHIWPRLVRDDYENRSFSEATNTSLVTDLLVQRFGADPSRDELQFLKEGIVIYPSSHFCTDLPPNYACHHFNGSWLNKGSAHAVPFVDEVRFQYYMRGALRLRGEAE